MVIFLPHLFIYLSPLELPDLFISLINYLTFLFLSLLNFLTFLSLQLITSPFYLPFSYSHLLNSLISSSLQLIASPIFYLNPMLRFFFSLHMVPIVLLLFESQGVFFPLWFLIGFTEFHAFIYFAQYFYFLTFGVLCSVGFIIL